MSHDDPTSAAGDDLPEDRRPGPRRDEAHGDTDHATADPRRVVPVLVAFGLSTAGAVGFVVAYGVGASQTSMGLALATALVGLGYGLVAWGHGLMPSGGAVEDRTPLADEDREQEAATVWRVGGRSVRRRGLLGGAFATALGATGLAALVPLGSLGPAPGNALRTTPWGARGRRLVTGDGEFVTATELDVGGILTVFPEGHVGSADGQAVLVRIGDVAVTPPGDPAGVAAGHVCYSKVCTHAGCPVGLYQAAQRTLLCPCHQSTFDVVAGARPLLGPAERALPQLPLAIDDQGFLVATGDFTAAVGPGWWSRP